MYITVQDHDGADTTQDGVKWASYHILRSFQLPPSLTQHLPNKSLPLLYHEVMLRRHKSSFTISPRDGHRMFLPMPSSHQLIRDNWTLGGQGNSPNISTHQCDGVGVV
jgi:hypothetical protein